MYGYPSINKSHHSICHSLQRKLTLKTFLSRKSRVSWRVKCVKKLSTILQLFVWFLVETQDKIYSSNCVSKSLFFRIDFEDESLGHICLSPPSPQLFFESCLKLPPCVPASVWQLFYPAFVSLSLSLSLYASVSARHGYIHGGITRQYDNFHPAVRGAHCTHRRALLQPLSGSASKAGTNSHGSSSTQDGCHSLLQGDNDGRIASVDIDAVCH